MEHKITDLQGAEIVRCGGALAAAKWCKEHGFEWRHWHVQYDQAAHALLMILQVRPVEATCQ